MGNYSKTKKIMMLILCGIVGSVIYRLPYLRENYYEALKQATGATNGQLGMLMSAYGIVNWLLYLPGGWAADKFSARSLITFSLISTGIGGFVFATFPPFTVILVLHAFWAFLTVFPFWAACIKVVRSLGDSSEQGKLFGFWSLGKGLTSTILGFITVPIFAKFGEGQNGLRAVIIFFSVICIVSGIISFIMIPSEKPVAAEKDENGFKFSDVLGVFKIPTVWLAGLGALCTWCIYIGFGYMTPYFTDIFQLGESQVALLSVLRANVLFALGGLFGGILADKTKTKSKFMTYAFIGMAVLSGVYLVIPGTGSVLPAIVNMFALGSFVYCANAVFFSLIDEANVPAKLTGTAAGLISLIAYAPDMFLYTAIGNIMDANPGMGGYRIIFIMMVVCAVVGVIVTSILHNINMKNRAIVQETKEA